MPYHDGNEAMRKTSFQAAVSADAKPPPSAWRRREIRHIAGVSSNRCRGSERWRAGVCCSFAAEMVLRRRELSISSPPGDHNPQEIDLIMGTFCIGCGHELLHSDRDFEPMERFLG